MFVFSLEKNHQPNQNLRVQNNIMPSPAYKRILLKLSGEILAGGQQFGIDPKISLELSHKIESAYSTGVQIGIVIGGGNIFRGVSAAASGMDRVVADYMGMMATIMNSVALQSSLESLNIDTRVMSALDITQLAEPYIRRKAIRHLEKNRVVIFAGGTGNPYFTTDTAAALRAIEIESDIVIKGTKVDGVYSSDPMVDSGATRYDSLSYKEVIDKELRVMDLTAVTLCKENNLPIMIIDLQSEDSLLEVLYDNKSVGTLVS